MECFGWSDNRQSNGTASCLPQDDRASHALSGRVFAVNPVTGKALPGANLKATLSDDEDKSNKKSFTRVATTGRNGEAILTFPSLGEPGDSLSLTVEGTLAGEGGALVQDSVTGDVDVLDLGSLHTEMDKPLHKLGETFHVRGLAFRDGGHVAADEPVTVTVAGPRQQDSCRSRSEDKPFQNCGLRLEDDRTDSDWRLRSTVQPG